MSEEKNEPVHQLMVYLGVRWHQTAQRAFTWADLPSATALLAPDHMLRTFTKKNLQRGAAPGSIYLMKQDAAERSVYVNAGTYVAQYADLETVQRWRIEHRAAEAMADLAGKAAAALRSKLDLELLDPWRVAYARAHGTKRGLILATVVEYLTKGQL